MERDIERDIETLNKDNKRLNKNNEETLRRFRRITKDRGGEGKTWYWQTTFNISIQY